jgi:hypothetical protein
MKLADGKGELVELFRGPQLRKAVLDEFPDLAGELETDDGVHWIMATLARAVMAAVEQGDMDRARATLKSLDGLLDRRDLDPEIENAISISFIEPELLRTSAVGRHLWEAMPVRIRTLLLENKNTGDVAQ